MTSRGLCPSPSLPDVHGLGEAHDLHVRRANPDLQRQRGGQPHLGPAVQRPVRLPLPGRRVAAAKGGLLQRGARGRAVAHRPLHALPHGERG